MKVLTPLLLCIVGSVVLLVLHVRYSEKEKTMLGWLLQSTQNVDSWVVMTISGTSSSPIRVQTENGSFNVNPTNGVLHRVEVVPVKQTGIMSLRIKQAGKTDMHVRAKVPFETPLYEIGTIRVVEVTPAPKWFISEDFETTRLPQGGVMMSDLHSSGEDVVFVPGKSSHFRCRWLLERFRASNLRLHVVYYEDHTYARVATRIDCGFSSRSIDRSVEHVRYALMLTKAKILMAFSLGGLVATTTVTRHPEVHLDALVLLNPFLSFENLVRYVDPTEPLGAFFVAGMRKIAPRHDGVPYMINKRKVKVGVEDFWKYAYPLSSPDPDQSSPPIQVSVNFVEATAGAISELKQKVAAKRVSNVPTLLIGCTQDTLVAHGANMRMCEGLFEDITIRTLPFTHYIFPSYDKQQHEVVEKNIMAFLSSKSRNVMIPDTDF